MWIYASIAPPSLDHTTAARSSCFRPSCPVGAKKANPLLLEDAIDVRDLLANTLEEEAPCPEYRPFWVNT